MIYYDESAFGDEISHREMTIFSSVAIIGLLTITIVGRISDIESMKVSADLIESIWITAAICITMTPVDSFTAASALPRSKKWQSEFFTICYGYRLPPPTIYCIKRS